jgi:lipoate-protein ligase A
MWIDDQIIQRCHERLAVDAWVPEQTVVVMGNSNKAESECYIEHCLADQVAILQRYGGGGTVVLYPGCVVVSIGAWVEDYFENKKYFSIFNQSIIQTLATLNTKMSALIERGISDIAFGEQKIAGTSLFRSRNYCLYQASILVELNFDAIDRYLKFPSKVPDYRRGRSHREFLTDLRSLGLSQGTGEIATLFKTTLPRTLLQNPALQHPVAEQFENLLKRVAK